jgi:hypothetical protein
MGIYSNYLANKLIDWMPRAQSSGRPPSRRFD